MDLLGAACWGAPLIIVPPKGKILSRFWTGAVGLAERARKYNRGGAVSMFFERKEAVYKFSIRWYYWCLGFQGRPVDDRCMWLESYSAGAIYSKPDERGVNFVYLNIALEKYILDSAGYYNVLIDLLEHNHSITYCCDFIRGTSLAEIAARPLTWLMHPELDNYFVSSNIASSSTSIKYAILWWARDNGLPSSIVMHKLRHCLRHGEKIPTSKEFTHIWYSEFKWYSEF